MHVNTYTPQIVTFNYTFPALVFSAALVLPSCPIPEVPTLISIPSTKCCTVRSSKLNSNYFHGLVNLGVQFSTHKQSECSPSRAECILIFKLKPISELSILVLCSHLRNGRRKGCFQNFNRYTYRKETFRMA